MIRMKLRNMTAIYILKGDKILMLYRQGGKVVNNVYVGTAGGHFEPEEVNDPTLLELYQQSAEGCQNRCRQLRALLEQSCP